MSLLSLLLFSKSYKLNNENENGHLMYLTTKLTLDYEQSLFLRSSSEKQKTLVSGTWPHEN